MARWLSPPLPPEGKSMSMPGFVRPSTPSPLHPFSRGSQPLRSTSFLYEGFTKKEEENRSISQERFGRFSSATRSSAESWRFSTPSERIATAHERLRKSFLSRTDAKTRANGIRKRSILIAWLVEFSRASGKLVVLFAFDYQRRVRRLKG